MTTEPTGPDAPILPAKPPRSRNASSGRRALARITHLGMAALLGAAIYAPPDITEPVRPLLQLGVLPLAAATGLFIWKQAAIQRVFARTARRLG